MFLYKFRSGHNVLMYLVTCYAILYFGLFEKAVSGFFFFLTHGDKIWPISDKCLFGASNNFEGYFDD